MGNLAFGYVYCFVFWSNNLFFISRTQTQLYSTVLLVIWFYSLFKYKLVFILAVPNVFWHYTTFVLHRFCKTFYSISSNLCMYYLSKLFFSFNRQAQIIFNYRNFYKHSIIFLFFILLQNYCKTSF